MDESPAENSGKRKEKKETPSHSRPVLLWKRPVWLHAPTPKAAARLALGTHLVIDWWHFSLLSFILKVFKQALEGKADFSTEGQRRATAASLLLLNSISRSLRWRDGSVHQQTLPVRLREVWAVGSAESARTSLVLGLEIFPELIKLLHRKKITQKNTVKAFFLLKEKSH